jgi:hypothetical protein
MDIATQTLHSGIITGLRFPKLLAGCCEGNIRSGGLRETGEQFPPGSPNLAFLPLYE